MILVVTKTKEESWRHIAAERCACVCSKESPRDFSKSYSCVNRSPMKECLEHPLHFSKELPVSTLSMDWASLLYCIMNFLLNQLGFQYPKMLPCEVTKKRPPCPDQKDPRIQRELPWFLYYKSFCQSVLSQQPWDVKKYRSSHRRVPPPLCTVTFGKNK